MKEKDISKLPISKIMSEYVLLKSRGKNMIGSCPFHNDVTGSFSVSDSLKIFKCFGCGKAGDVISFYSEHFNIPVSSAIKILKEKYFSTLGLKLSDIPSVKGTAYALELINENYFVGFTTLPLRERLLQHKAGNASVWTKNNPPIKTLEYYKDTTVKIENELAEKYYAQFGYDKVRGGDQFYFEKKYKL